MGSHVVFISVVQRAARKLFCWCPSLPGWIDQSRGSTDRICCQYLEEFGLRHLQLKGWLVEMRWSCDKCLACSLHINTTQNMLKYLDFHPVVVTSCLLSYLYSLLWDEACSSKQKPLEAICWFSFWWISTGSDTSELQTKCPRFCQWFVPKSS